MTVLTLPSQLQADISPHQLCLLAVRVLARMYSPEHRLFCHHLGLAGGGLKMFGFSRRYTATVLLGLSRTPSAWRAEALAGRDVDEIFDGLAGNLGQAVDPGEVALTLWAARAWGHPLAEAANRRLRQLRPESAELPMVELAWCLAASTAQCPAPRDDWLAGELARRIVASIGPAGLFPHWPVGVHRPWLRAPLCCFADQVYPIQALSLHHLAAGSGGSVATARRCAARLVRLQGKAGQWWWHYDVRTGQVVERYPVYAVHQTAMGPMALAALRLACGADIKQSIDRGLQWLAKPSEIRGSLIDPSHGVIWRKVARHEPGRLVRTCQAAACRLHRSLRVPGLGLLFRPSRIDYETRPYHMGWILYAWATPD